MVVYDWLGVWLVLLHYLHPNSTGTDVLLSSLKFLTKSDKVDGSLNIMPKSLQKKSHSNF